MIVSLAFCHKDYLAADKLFRWMAELEGKQHGNMLLLIAAKGTPTRHIDMVKSAAGMAFETVITKMPMNADERGWPLSANTMFFTAYHEVKRMSLSPFMWIESDCVPLKPGWVDTMFKEYAESHKAFMGCVYQRPFPHLTGVAIYPTNIEQYNLEILSPGLRPWDIINPSLTIPHTHHTQLFQHEWGNHKYNIAPSFPNQASLSLVREDAVLFHRCKDGSLIDRLREKAQWPKYCKVMAMFGNPSNRYQDYDEVDFKQFKP
jgi:hypothetical protein